MKIGILGRTQLLYDAIPALIKKGHTIAFIMTCEAAPEYTIKADDFKKLAQKHKIPFLFTKTINSPEVLAWVKKFNPEAGVSMNWKGVVGKNILNAFKLGVINGHAGDLPLYRGNAVINWAILQKEKNITLTLHFMAEEIDCGPVLLKRKMPLNDNVYIHDVYDFIDSNFPLMVIEALDGLKKGTLKPVAQPTNNKLALRCYPRCSRDGEINWAASADQIARLVRANAEPFPGAYTFWGSEKLVIWRARAEKDSNRFLGVPGQVAKVLPKSGEIYVITGKHFLVLEEIQFGKTRAKAAEIIKSIYTRLGMDHSSEIEKLNLKIHELELKIKKIQSR